MRGATVLGVLLSAVSWHSAPCARATSADDICPPASDPCLVSSARSVAPGSILDFGGRALVIGAEGKLTVSGGSLAVRAGSVTLEPKGEILGLGGDTGSNLAITTTGDIRVRGGGSTNARIDTSAALNAGQIDLTAGGTVDIDGFVNANGTSNDGGGGVVNVIAAGNVSFDGAVKLKGGSFNMGGFLTVSGRDIAVTGLIDVSAADGGIIDVEALGGITQAGSGQMVLKGSGGLGDGGELSLIARGDIVLGGTIVATGAGTYASGGGTGSDILLISEEGSITLSGTTSFNGAPPDGGGGELDASAAVDLTQTGPLFGHGNGSETYGGTVLLWAGRRLTLGATIRVDGGFFGGGAVIAEAKERALLGATIDGSASGGGGLVTVNAGQASVSGRVNVSGTAAGAAGGSVSLQSCDLTLLAGSSLSSNGTSGKNLLQASGQMTIGGSLSATAGGTNQLEFRDPLRAPVILPGASVNPSASVVQNAALPECVANGAVCGNGVPEAGEGCDDGNAAACDGCSAACRVEACGNAVIECGEECDNGAGNGAPGNPCDATCRVVHAGDVLMKPGKRVGPAACLLEWALRNPAGATDDGFPETTQRCIDGDPACDADGANDGACVFSVAACLAPIDARLPKCQPSAVASVQIRKPNPVSPRNAVDGANALALVDAAKALGVTVSFKDTVFQVGVPTPARGLCSPEFGVRVPHPGGTSGSRMLKAGATDSDGRRLRANRLALMCVHNPAVCGNGVIEVGEQCDDGNTASCDGCASGCRVEACGNGVVDCGEDCDEGPANGAPGGRCTASCTEAPPPLRIPGGSRGTECVHEWSVATATPRLTRRGMPHVRQDCVDGDPGCDFEPAPGVCRLHVWSCLGGDDASIACVGEAAQRVDVLRPRATQSGFHALARVTLVDALGRLAMPVGPGERCTRRMDLEVPAGRRRLAIRVAALGASGKVDRDSLKLSCRPAMP